MRKASIAVAFVHRVVSVAMQLGIITQELDRIIENVILGDGATPSSEGLYGLPAATCVSINSVVAHGILGDAALCDGDIISMDIDTCRQRYHGNSVWTYGVGKPNEEDQQLMRVSEESLYEGLEMARAENHLTDISHATGECVFTHGYLIPRNYAGHGIGTSVHGDPTVPNFDPADHGILLQENMTLAVEPMIRAGKPQARMLKDGWGVVTRDDNRTVRFEHAIVTTDRGYEILITLNKEECPNSG